MTTHRHHSSSRFHHGRQAYLDHPRAMRLRSGGDVHHERLSPDSSPGISDAAGSAVFESDGAESGLGDINGAAPSLAIPQSPAQSSASADSSSSSVSPDFAPDDSFPSLQSPSRDFDIDPSATSDSSNPQLPENADALNTMIDLLRQIAQNTAAPQPGVLGA